MDVSRTDVSAGGADVFVKGYLNVDASWIYLGKSPIESAQLPNRHNRWRLVKEGFEPSERDFISYFGAPPPVFKLSPKGAVPAGMTAIAGGTFQTRGLPPVRFDDYWLDKYEVTSKQFKEFIDQGGCPCASAPVSVLMKLSQSY